jgi:hypothetical protein
MNAFSYFAKTAMNDFSMEDINPDDLVNHYICCEVVHNVQPSNKDPKKTVTFCNLGDKSVAEGFDTTPVPLALSKVMEESDKTKPSRGGKKKPTAAPAPDPAPAPAAAPAQPEATSSGLDLDALLARSYEICEALMKANVGEVRSEGRSLKSLFRNDLVVFGGYLVEGDGVIAPDEVEFVHTALGLAPDAPVIEQLRRRTLDTSSAKETPFSLKYAVLADAGVQLEPEVRMWGF